MQLQNIVVFVGLVVCAYIDIVFATEVTPSRQAIPGSFPTLSRQFSNETPVRVLRPKSIRTKNPLLSSITQRGIEEPKPVTEAPEDDNLQNSFLPTLLREQQIAQAQQAQFHQTAADFFNSEPNTIPDTPSQIIHDERDFALPILPELSPTRVSGRTPLQRSSQFIDYDTDLVNTQRSSIQTTAVPTQAAPIAQQVNVKRSRQPIREQRLQLKEAVPSPIRSRPNQAQVRPLVEYNQVQDENRNSGTRRQRPVAQTLRKWREENEDGSITWGYENDDGSFKEEIIGFDCITKGTYGYIDPEGNKREYHYETGIKCDQNTRDSDKDVEENGFINYEENRAILPNGLEIDMSQLGKKKSRRPEKYNN